MTPEISTTLVHLANISQRRRGSLITVKAHKTTCRRLPIGIRVKRRVPSDAVDGAS